MARIQHSRGLVRPLMVIIIILTFVIGWVLYGSLRTLPFLKSLGLVSSSAGHPSLLNSLEAETQSVYGIELLDRAGLRASANIDWSMLYGRTEAERLQVSAAIIEASQTYAVNANLLRAIIMAESEFNDKAVSKKGARGLMQLMPTTALEVGVSDMHDPRENILGGTAYFSGLLQEFNGDIRLSLAAYNAGPKNVHKLHGSIPLNTTAYVNRVLSYYRFFGG